MADIRAGIAIRTPIRYVNAGVAGSQPHYLDGAPSLEVEGVRVVADPEIGPQNVGFCDDFTDTLSLPTAAGTGTRHKINGTGTPAAALRDDVAAGVLRLTTTAAAGDDCILVRQPAICVIPAATSGLRTYFTAKVALVENVSQGACIIGISLKAYANVDTEPTDGIYFYKADAGSDFKFVVRKSSTSTTVTTTALATAGVTLTAATFVEFSFRSETNGSIGVYVNGIKVGSYTADANLPATVSTTTVVIGRSNGATAAARNLDLDYYLYAQDV
jgi:hypothetical protein